MPPRPATGPGASESTRVPRRAPRDRDGGFQTIVPAPFGALGVRVHDGMLWTIDCLPRCRSWLVPGDPLAARMMEALERYLQDPKTPWTLPVARRFNNGCGQPCGAFLPAGP